MIGVETASVETIEQECHALEDDLAHVDDQIRIYRESLHHLQRRVARAGGEDYLDVAEKHHLDSVRHSLEEKELERQDIRYNLDDKKAELHRNKEIEILRRQLDRAINQKQVEKAWKIASRKKTLEPLLAATIDSELVRFHWQMVIDDPGENYEASRKAWEKLETVCYEIGDDTGLKQARQELARLFEERGEEKEDQEQYRSAVHFYRRALDKYGLNDDRFDQRRILGKLIHAHKNQGEIEAALRYSSARIELLGHLARPREAERCYFQALDICSDLTEESRQSHWELALTRLIINRLDHLDDTMGLERLRNYSVQSNKREIQQLVTPVLEMAFRRIKQPLRIAA